eukprot:1337719-Alexandrium_andersonii.AAC.1
MGLFTRSCHCASEQKARGAVMRMVAMRSLATTGAATVLRWSAAAGREGRPPALASSHKGRRLKAATPRLPSASLAAKCRCSPQAEAPGGGS